MIPGIKVEEIKVGDKLKCLNCLKPITVSDETVKITYSAEYIICPDCKKALDIQLYHLYGEKLNEE